MRTRSLLLLASLVLPSLAAAQKPAPPPTPPTGPPPAQPRNAAPVRQIGPVPGPGRDTLNEPKNPFDGNAIAIREGRRLFNWFNCAGCHGDHGGGGMGPSLRDSTWVYGGTDARIFNSIHDGRTKGMPAWGTTLPAEQIWKIVAYIRTMRTSKEPDRP